MKILSLKISSIVIALALIGNGAFAQAQPNQIASWLQTVETAHQAQPIHMLEHTELQTRSLPVNDADFLLLDHDQLSSLFENQPALIEFEIPRGNEIVNLKLARVNVTSEDFTVGTNTGEEVLYKNGIHYRGIVDGDNSSVAALSFFKDEVMGFYNTTEGNYTIGKVEGETDVMAVYNAKQLPQLEGTGCFTEDPSEPITYSNDGNHNRGIGCKTVKVYFECDNALYVNKGSSTTNVTNYVTGLFNQVATLYANENIDIQISEIYVWTTIDPYATLTTTSAVLSSFRTTKGTNFNGNLAHFLTTRNLGGGIAYVDVICSKSYAFGVSMIYSTYSSVPTYSWSVECVTHELGHNLGSSHTQSCSWVGGPIDNCYAVEGTCSPGPTPVNGGTIMSYCHLSSVGINFNNGFGTQPGDLIRSRVLNATCLTASGTIPTGLTTSGITTSASVLAWVAVPGTTQYTVQYKAATSSTWLTATTTSLITYTLTGLTAGTSYNWQVKTDCSAYSAANTFSTTTSTTSCAAPGGLTSSNITTSSASIAWSAVSGATDYTVQYKTSAASTYTTLGTYTTSSTSITGLVAATTYNWQVKSSCSTGYSTVSSLTTSSTSTTCSAPTALIATNIATTSATLNWTAASGASSYTVRYRRSGTTSWYNTTTSSTNKSITNLLNGNTYQWKVKANCSAYSSIVSFNTPAAIAAMTAVAEVASLNLYPNPAQNEIHIHISGWVSNASGVADIYNITGALVKSISVKAEDNLLQINEFITGMYMVYIRKEGSAPIVARFVKD